MQAVRHPKFARCLIPSAYLSALALVSGSPVLAQPPMPSVRVPVQESRSATEPSVSIPTEPSVSAKGEAIPKPQVWPLQMALHYALANNPGLAVQRSQRGIAAARVVIADTYPFNPVLENRIQQASGPASGGITNQLPIENLFLWEVELKRQGQYRRQGAAAALTRTEWEIAFQEQALAIDVTRAYMAMVYRQDKLKLVEETLRVNESLIEDVRRLVNLGKLRSADLIVVQTEVADTLDLVGTAKETLAAARQDLNRSLGMVESGFATEGALEAEPFAWESKVAAYGDLALTRRADLKARQLAIAEADANRRLAVANRHGNPIVGTVVTYDPSRVASVGVQLNIPLPFANKHRGEIMQTEAEQALAVATLVQNERAVKQEVASAFARLGAAQQRLEQSRTRGLPALTQAVQDMEKLFQAGEPGVDVLRVIDVRRKVLRARDSHLDALWSVRQALIDVAAATAEPLVDLAAPATP